MIKNLIFFGSFFLFLASCQKSDENLSKLRQSNDVSYTINEIQPGTNGAFYCIAPNSRLSEMLVLQYDRKLNLIKTTNLMTIAPFDSGKQIKCRYNTVNNTWFITARSSYSSPSSAFKRWKTTLYQTDEAFKVIEQKELLDRKVSGNYAEGGWVHEMLLSKAGDLVMAWDTGEVYSSGVPPYFKENGLRITQFDQNLNEVFSFRGSKLGYPSNPPKINDLSIVLNQNDDIYYGYSLGSEARMVFGKLDAKGALVYQKVNKLNAGWITCNGVSLFENKMIYSGVSEVENFQFYVDLDANTGEIGEQHYLPNNIYNWGDQGENPLPKNMIENAGHFVYSRSLNKVQFFSVSSNAVPNFRFNLELPDIQYTISYRQMLIDHKSMIVAVSYVSDNKNQFTLMKMDLKGSIIL